MSAAVFDLAEGMAVLERTPAVLRAWLGDLPEPWWRANEGPDTWSPFDSAGHLIDGEETDWIPRARIFPDAGGGPPLHAVRSLPAPADCATSIT